MSGEIQFKSPYADWETRAFWEGCGRHELVLQRCTRCQQVQHRPRAICARCLSSEIEHFVASGRGRIYTFTVVYQNQMPGYRSAGPYVLAYVQLDEGPQLMTHIVGCDPQDVRIDMPVEVEFVDVEGDESHGTEGRTAIPRFHPA